MWGRRAPLFPPGLHSETRAVQGPTTVTADLWTRGPRERSPRADSPICFVSERWPHTCRHTCKMRSDLVARLARFVLGGLCEVWIFDVLAPFSVQCGLACQAENMAAASATSGHRVHGLPPYFDNQVGWSSEASSVSGAVSVAAVSVAEEPGADAVLVDVAFDDDEPHEPEPNPSEPPEPEEPLEEPEGPDGMEEDENPFHQKAVELVPGVWLGSSSAVGTTEPAGEPSQEVGGGANGPLKSPSPPPPPPPPQTDP